jgi:hypothetical protein
VSFYQVGLGESSKLLALTMLVISLLLVQLTLLVLKLSLYLPASFRAHLSWGVVFLPIWIFFVLFCVIQCTRYHLDAPTFLATLILLWNPFLILFILLTIKLEFNNDGKGAIRLAYVFIPFFALEAFFMLGSAMALIAAYLRYCTMPLVAGSSFILLHK